MASTYLSVMGAEWSLQKRVAMSWSMPRASWLSWKPFGIRRPGKGHPKGTVKVGVTPTVAEIVTVPLVKRIRESHPELGIRFSSAFSGHLLDWLQRGELELAVSYNPQLLRSLLVLLPS